MATPAASADAPYTKRLQERLALYGVGVASTTSDDDSSTINSSSARHRSLVALQDFPAGSIILQSTPHSFVLTGALPTDGDPSASRRKCEWCGQSTGDVSRCGSVVVDKLLRCSSCKLSEYCSHACQKSAWKSFHSFECKHLWQVETKVRMLSQLAAEARLDLLLLGRCVRKRTKEQATATSDAEAQLQLERDGAPLASGFDDLAAMESHYDFIQRCIEQHGDKKDGATGSPAAAVPALSDAQVLSMAQRLTDNTQLLSFGFRLGLFGATITPGHVNSLLLPVLSSFQSNNFAITNSILTAVGAGVYPLGALLNHSCEANCCIVYEERFLGERRDRRAGEWLAASPGEVLNNPLAPSSHLYPAAATHVQTIRTLRAVKAGEELTHSYIDAAAVTSKRRQILWDRYYFTCGCSRCRANDADADAQGEAQGGEDLSAALESFLERDLDGNQLPEEILEHSPAANPSCAALAAKLPGTRHADLLRANHFWAEATRLHLEENSAGNGAAFEAEEVRRNRAEQTLISSALSIRLQHLHPYSLPLLTTYSKLLHACLLTGEFDAAIHACEMLCRKYRVVYGSEEIRREELRRCERLRLRLRLNADADADEGEDAGEDVDEDVEHVCEYKQLSAHPLLGLQLYTLASLYSQQNQFRLAYETFQSALAVLLVSHGFNSPLVVKLRAEMAQALAVGAADIKQPNAAPATAAPKSS